MTIKTKTEVGADRVDGSALIPRIDDLNTPGVRRGVLKRQAFWIGLHPNCPVEAARIAGISFPKACEIVTPARGPDGETQRVWVFGSIVRLSRQQWQQIVDRIPRTVVRFYADEPEEAPTTDVPQSVDPRRRPQRGKLVTIPSEAEVEKATKLGRAVNYYVRQDGDRPLADFAYMIPCKDQAHPEREGGGMSATTMPKPLSSTGLTWPTARAASAPDPLT